MAWRRARSLVVLEQEIQEVAPGTTVWDIGDEDHQRRASDHNPNPAGVVCAIDVLGNAGLDLAHLAETVRTSGHPAGKYVIYRDRIASASRGWRWRSYGGAFHSHVHVSVGRGPDGQSTGPYDDQSPWGLAEGGNDMIGLTEGDEGQDVKGLQAMLRKAGHSPGEVDGIYGPATSAAVLEMRKSVGSSAKSGKAFTGHAYAQLHEAIIRRYAGQAAKKAADNVRDALEAALPAAGELPARVVLDLPDTIIVPVEPAGDEDDEGGT